MTNSASEHIATVIEFLNQNADYAVLRNYEGLPDKNTSRDIDIIITAKSLHSIKKRLIDLIDKSGWKIINYLNSDRLITYVCAHIDANGKADLIQWDFFINTSVFGILLMDAKEFLAHKQFNGFLYYVGIECQFLDKYLYNRAVGSSYPAKYHATRSAAENLPAVSEKLQALFGKPTVEACDRASSRKLLFHAILANLKNPFTFVARVSKFLYTFSKNYICSNTGFSIGFTGPDGSGKTTVIDLMIKEFGEVFRQAHSYYHFRPTLFGNLGEVAHSAGLKKEVDREYDKPHRGGKTSAFNSFLRLIYYTIDYIVGYFIKVKSKTRITHLVIFDRYYTDIICDSRRSRIYLNPKFLYRWGRLFIPSLDYNILLTASTETILARKKELDESGIQAINGKIDYLSDKKGYLKILNEDAPGNAVQKILTQIFEKQHTKNLKRLK